MRFLRLSAVLLLACTLGCGGCGGRGPTPKAGPSTTTNNPTENGGDPKEGKDKTNAKAKDDGGAFVLGDLIPKDFSPPETIEELDAKVKWKDGAVLDSMKLMRERQAGEKPLAKVEEALALKNTSKENNAKILLLALGRMPASDAEVDWDGAWLRHSAADVKSTNPLMISSTAEFDVVGLIGGGLFGFDWNFTPFASSDTVVQWQTSEDGLYDKVIMRDDWTWSDGNPVTAHDVEFSYRVIMSKRVPIPAVRSGTDELQGVKAYDDHTLVFFHKESLATNVWNINFPIIPKHIYENSVAGDPTLAESPHHIKHDENPVTSGAYTISKRERGQQIVLKRRDSFYMHNGKQVRDKPHFGEIRFKIVQDPSTALLALKKGDVEEMEITPEQWMTQTGDDEFYSKNTKVRDIEWVYFYFGWNVDTPFFADRKVRQAMSYVFDHKELMDKHRFGLDEACTGIFHRTAKWAPTNPPKPYQQDLDKAEELLEEAGWTDSDNDGTLDAEYKGKRIRFEFTINTSNRQDRIDVCNLLRENLDQIGIICKVRPMEFTVLSQKMQDHQFQAVFGGWGTGADPDTSENLWTTKAIDNGRNYGKYSNPEIDALFEQGKRELNVEERIKIYQQIHMKLWEDQPYTWLYFRNAYYGFNKDLRGYTFSPRGPYNYGPGEGSIFKPAVMQ